MNCSGSASPPEGALWSLFPLGSRLDVHPEFVQNQVSNVSHQLTLRVFVFWRMPLGWWQILTTYNHFVLGNVLWPMLLWILTKKSVSEHCAFIMTVTHVCKLLISKEHTVQSSRMQGTRGEKWIRPQPIRANSSDKIALLWVFPMSCLSFYHRSSQPSSSNEKIRVTNTLSHRELSVAFTEWAGLIIPVTESSVYKLGGYSSVGSTGIELSFLCVKCTGSSERMTVSLLSAVIVFFDPSLTLPKSQHHPLVCPHTVLSTSYHIFTALSHRHLITQSWGE